MGAVFWCAGMFASGSTWVYNVMREAAALHAPPRPVSARFVNTRADMTGLDDTTARHVVKSHDLAEDTAAALSAYASALVVTIRDPRDAVTSLMLYQRYPFHMAVETIAKSAHFVGGFAGDARALLLRYEDNFTDQPATIDRIAAHLGMPLAAAERDRIFAATRRQAVEGLITALAGQPHTQHDKRTGNFFDPTTQWHKHHLGRTGEIGRWRRALTSAQAAAVDAALPDWMARFGYPQAPKPPPIVTTATGYTLDLDKYR
jgi:hypothetical protein